MYECQLCQKGGHTAQNCFLNKNVNQPKVTCQICNKLGDSTDKCFQRKRTFNQTSIEPVKILTCQICNKFEDEARYCRTLIQEIEECRYCKRPGHVIEDCRKRKYNEEQNAGNGGNLQGRNASMEVRRNQEHSNQINCLQKELLPLDKIVNQVYTLILNSNTHLKEILYN